MRPLIQARPRFCLGYCHRDEADRSALTPSDVRAKFSPVELAAISALPQRRRRDRIAGRLAAKRALAAHFMDEHGWDFDAAELVVENALDGRPLLRLPAHADVSVPSFSLSHGLDAAVCAVGAPGRLVGVDVETVVARPPAVIAFIASPAESHAAPASDPDAQARLWTGKEAALKLLGLGLDADARDVRVRSGEVVYCGIPERVWMSLGAPRVRVAYESIAVSASVAGSARFASALIAVAYTGD